MVQHLGQTYTRHKRSLWPGDHREATIVHTILGAMVVVVRGMWHGAKQTNVEGLTIFNQWETTILFPISSSPCSSLYFVQTTMVAHVVGTPFLVWKEKMTKFSGDGGDVEGEDVRSIPHGLRENSSTDQNRLYVQYTIGINCLNL